MMWMNPTSLRTRARRSLPRSRESSPPLQSCRLNSNRSDIQTFSWVQPLVSMLAVRVAVWQFPPQYFTPVFQNSIVFNLSAWNSLIWCDFTSKCLNTWNTMLNLLENHLNSNFIEFLWFYCDFTVIFFETSQNKPIKLLLGMYVSIVHTINQSFKSKQSCIDNTNRSI